MTNRLFRLSYYVAVSGLLLSSHSAWAQAEIAAYGGGAHFAGGTHAVAGGSVGVRASQLFQVFGDANYIPLSSVKYSVPGISGSTSQSTKLLNFGGGVMAGMPANSGKVLPYALAVAGIGHSSVSGNSIFSGIGASVSDNSVYVGGGAGLRMMISESWGFRPEVRLQRYLQNGGSTLVLFTGGIFFNFGK